jgi:hypothetical protein
LTPSSQGALQINSPFDNQGTIKVASGCTLQVASDFITGRTLTGDGIVGVVARGEELNNGVIEPGTSIGTLTLDGDLEIGAAGLLQLELTGTGNFDHLTITDDATFGGNLSW